MPPDNARRDLTGLRARILEFVAVRSHSGEEERMARVFAQALSLAGADVVVDEEFSGSPSVIGRVRFGEGPTLQLAGHLDTVPVAHDPPRYRHGKVFGRGSCDMKAGLAAMVEVVRGLVESQVPERGELLVTAYGLHEGAGRHEMHAPLRSLLRRGIRGDAVIVCEGPDGFVPVAGKGALIFSVTFEDSHGGPLHELMRQHEEHPILAAHDFMVRLLERAKQWSLRHPVLGSESVFFGSIHGGDVYNAVPRFVEVQGTRRYPPPRTLDEAVAELEDVCRSVERECGVRVGLNVQRSGQPFEQGSAQPIIQAVIDAHAEETGHRLPAGGQLFASDVNHFVADFGVPAAAYGVPPTSAHSTPEYVLVSDAERLARVLTRSAIKFLNVPQERAIAAGEAVHDG